MNQAISLNLPRLLTTVASFGLISATCTVERFDGTLGPSGTPAREDDANWDEVTGLIDIPCMAASDIFQTRMSQATERRAPHVIAKEEMKQIMLDGFYAGIQAEDRLVLTWNGADWTLDILGVEHDSQGTQTRLAVRNYEF